MKKQKDKYTKILLWAYKKQETGFTWGELKQECSLSDSEESWVKKIFNTTDDRDRKFVEHFRNDDSVEPNVHYYSLNEKGISAALDAIRERQSRIINWWAIGIAAASFLVAAITGCLAYKSLNTTIMALELTTPTMLEISSVYSDQVNEAIGFIDAQDSEMQLILTNNSFPTVENIDIRMTLWSFGVDKASRVLKVCPIGYVGHTTDSVFEISNLQTDNVLNWPDMTLYSGDTYDFSFNYQNLKHVNLPAGSLALLKIDINYVKKSNQAREKYSKFYLLFNQGHVVDVEVNPTLGLGIIDGSLKTDVDPSEWPRLVYPFKQEEFINYVKNLPSPSDFFPGQCEKFSLSEKPKIITY